MSSQYQSNYEGRRLGDSERNYRDGTWGKGTLDAKDLASKFGLDRSQQGTGDDHIWGTNTDGSKVYIGKISGDLKHNQELIQAHSRQANPLEVDHSGIPESLSSSGDVKGAILNMWKSDDQAPEATPKEPDTPVVHSDRQKEALERVARWEDPKHPEYHNFSERIFGSDNEIANNSDTFNRSAEYDSERTEYDFSDDVFSNDSNQAAANETEQANELLESYKNKIASTFGTIA